MTTEPSTEPAPPAPPEPDRLPDDHPAAKALAKANKEAETLRLQLKEIEDRDKSELQKLQEALAASESKLSDLPKQARQQAIKFASAATAKGFLDPEDALTFMADDVDLSDSKAVQAALDELAERKPHLIRQEPAKKLPQRPKPPAGERDDDDKPSGKERAAAALRQFRNS